MLDHKGFDLWADGYDLAVGLSDEDNTYPFAGYKEILGRIFRIITEKPNAVVLDIGFGTGTLTAKLYESGCVIYGQDFSPKMIDGESAAQREKTALYAHRAYRLISPPIELPAMKVFARSGSVG